MPWEALSDTPHLQVAPLQTPVTGSSASCFYSYISKPKVRLSYPSLFIQPSKSMNVNIVYSLYYLPIRNSYPTAPLKELPSAVTALVLLLTLIILTPAPLVKVILARLALGKRPFTLLSFPVFKADDAFTVLQIR